MITKAFVKVNSQLKCATATAITAQSHWALASQNPKSSVKRFTLFRDDFRLDWSFETLSDQRLVSVKPRTDLTEIGSVAESI